MLTILAGGPIVRMFYEQKKQHFMTSKDSEQTQEFISAYNQIRDLQKYVAILRNANLNPNDHMTDSQKILLQRAQYFDQLNQLAYFPGSNVA